MKKSLALILTILTLSLTALAPSTAYAEEQVQEQPQVQEQVQAPVEPAPVEPAPVIPEQPPVVMSYAVQPVYPAMDSFTIAVKQKRPLTVAVLPAEANNSTVTWTSSNPSIVSVDANGVIVGQGVGTAYVSAHANDGSGAYFTYTVNIVARKKGNNFSTKNMDIVSTSTAKYTYNQLQIDLAELSAKYGDRMSYAPIGTTLDNRNIYEVIIGNQNAKKHIIVQSTMHAREYINSLLTMRQIESICRNYYTGTYNSKYYSELLDKVCLHVVPMVNPDGVTISQYGANGINDPKLRKIVKNTCKKYGGNSRYYLTRWKANARGVDLNRNYPMRFSIVNKLRHPAQKNYGGKAPFSEPESQTMANLVNTVKPKMIFSYHSTGSIVYWNFGQKGKLQKQCRQLYSIVHSQTGYSPASGGGRLNPCFGDWVCGGKKIPTVTVETGTGECPIGIREFKTIWRKNAQMIPSMLNWASEN